MEENLRNRDDLLAKLRIYRNAPDDENIQYKQKIKNALLLNPCLLYAIHQKDLEPELFDGNGNINWEYNEELKQYEPLGEWSKYFGETANIRPYLFIPDTQTEVKNYVCYQVSFDELPRYTTAQKYTQITFTIFIHENDTIDKLTGIPRHDLIASILRERFNWSNIFGMQTHLISSKESIADNHYTVRTLVFQLVDTNGLVNTPHGGKTTMNNYQLRR